VIVGLLLGAWLLVASVALLVFVAALRQAHLADERFGWQEAGDAGGASSR